MPSYAEALYSLSASSLQELINLRGLDERRFAKTSDKRSMVQLLASELNRQTSTWNAIMLCNARQLRLLQICGSVDNSRDLTWQKLVELAGGPEVEAGLIEPMKKLEALGLAFRLGNSVFVPETVLHVAPASLSDRYTLARLLNVYDAPAIRRIADNLGLELNNTPKSVNIEQISKKLFEGAKQHRFSPTLSQEEVEVLDFMLQMGGSATPIEVANIVLKGKTDDFFRYEWQNRWKLGKEKNAIDRLLARGIVHVTTSGYGYNFFLVIPGDLIQHLAGGTGNDFWTGPEPMPMPMVPQQDKAYRNSSILRDVVSMLSFFAVQAAVRTNTGHIHKASVKAIARTLSVSDESYTLFVYAIIRAAGLAEPQGENRAYTLTKAGNDWLRLGSTAQRKILIDAWRTGTVWVELFQEPIVRQNEYRSEDAAITARESIIELLSVHLHDDPDCLLTINSIESSLTFARPLLLSEGSSGSNRSVTTITGFIENVIFDSLFWLGVVDVAFSESGPELVKPSVPETHLKLLSYSDVNGAEEDEPEVTRACRLNNYGRMLVPGFDAPPDDPREQKFIVQANSEIYISPYIEPWIRYRLLTFAAPPAAGAVTGLLSLNRESIRRALDLGDTPANILDFLRQNSSTGVPQNVEYLINEVGGKHGHIRIGHAEMYIKVDTPILLKELRARKELKPYFVRDLSETIAILNTTDLEKVLKELRKGGYFPVSDEISFGTAFNATAATQLEDDKLDEILAGLLSKSKTSNRISAEPVQKNKPFWDNIAKEDGSPWHRNVKTPSSSSGGTEGSLAKPDGAYDNPNLIRVLMHNACITHNIIDMVWIDPSSTGNRLLFEPVQVFGTYVRGYSRQVEEVMDVEFDQIKWAKLTPNKYGT